MPSNKSLLLFAVTLCSLAFWPMFIFVPFFWADWHTEREKEQKEQRKRERDAVTRALAREQREQS